jgi:prepilin-type N-terminal cleavage/methylation domain-containing protein
MKMMLKSKNTNKTRSLNGFTLVELLIVIAIVGILAAIIVPNLSALTGAGKNESAAAELSQVQSALDTMMVKNGLSSVTATTATNNMAAFPQGNPLYPDFLRSSTTSRNYACTSGGLVTAEGQSTTTTTSTTTTPTPTLTSTTTTPTTTTTTTTTAAYAAWVSNTAYQPGSYVSYNGGVFYARYYASENQKPAVVGNPWQEVTDQWRDFNVYLSGDKAWVNGKQFQARNWSQNQTPGLIASPWQELTDQWRDFNVYQGGVTVWYNGHQYRAKYYSQNITPGSSDAWILVS